MPVRIDTGLSVEFDFCIKTTRKTERVVFVIS